MKNIHILRTDKPSRLYYSTSMNGYKLNLSETSKYKSSEIKLRNICITNDEEIKEGDYFIDQFEQLWKHNGIIKPYIGSRKITLTTDQDLIKDGVQAIDDEFLEWFVQNPSCEEVKVTKNIGLADYSKSIENYKYKIIIPKEEPKQETTLEEAEKEFEKLINGKGLPTKQLLEVAEHYFIVGYEIAKENNYSEEDMKLAIRFGFDKGFCSNSSNKKKNTLLSEQEWFEQFKIVK